MTPVKHSLPSASFAGARRWINAVAMMTPDPKYFAMKKTQFGTSLCLLRFAITGKTAPKVDATRMTKMDEMRTPMRPSYSLEPSQEDMVLCFGC